MPNIQNHAAMKGVTFPTGSASHAMLLVTRTLVRRRRALTGQAYFRALDKRTGQTLWEGPTGGSRTGRPMTDLHNGRQFIVFASAGGETEGFSPVDRVCPSCNRRATPLRRRSPRSGTAMSFRLT